MEGDVPVIGAGTETGTAMAKVAMERTAATMVVNFMVKVFVKDGMCWRLIFMLMLNSSGDKRTLYDRSIMGLER